MKITFLGGGNMANALIGGMLKQGFAESAICWCWQSSRSR